MKEQLERCEMFKTCVVETKVTCQRTIEEREATIQLKDAVHPFLFSQNDIECS